MPDSDEITGLLERLRQGDESARTKLIGIVYPELRGIARRLLSGERSDHTFETTDLVHEAYLRLAPSAQESRNRAQFYAVASQVMRHVLVDYARRRLADKRGGGGAAVELLDTLVVSEDHLDQVLIFEDLIRRLEKTDERSAQVVVFRFYGGMQIEEIAEELEVSPRTVKRDLRYGRAWLHAEFKSRPPEGNSGFENAPNA